MPARSQTQWGSGPSSGSMRSSWSLRSSEAVQRGTDAGVDQADLESCGTEAGDVLGAVGYWSSHH